jgi:protein TonB
LHGVFFKLTPTSGRSAYQVAAGLRKIARPARIAEKESPILEATVLRTMPELKHSPRLPRPEAVARSLGNGPQVDVSETPRRIPPPRLPRRVASPTPQQWSRGDAQVAAGVPRAQPTSAAAYADGGTGKAQTVAATVGLARGGNGGGHGGPGAGRLDGLPSGLISNPAPWYPPDLLARGVEGTVDLRVWIGEDGSVQAVKIHVSSGQPTMDQSALETVRDQWRFVPGKQNGIDVPCEVFLAIRFHL